MHAENYLTLRWQRRSAAALESELTAARADGVREDGGDAPSRAKLLEIEHALAEGHEHYQAGAQERAIDAYKRAQGLVYQLLFPSFPIQAATRADISFTADMSLFAPLLAAGLEFAEAVSPRRADEETFGAPFVDLPKRDRMLERMDRLGVNIADGIPSHVRAASHLAQSYAERGQWERAEFYLRQASDQLAGQDGDATLEALAAIDLNLAATLLQQQRPDEAEARLQASQERFAALQDLVGLAQTMVNQAALLARRGEHGAAAETLAQADRTLNEAEGRSQDERGSAAGLTEAPAARLGSTRPDALYPVLAAGGFGVTYRQPTRSGGWSIQRVETQPEAREKQYVKQVGFTVGNDPVLLEWRSGQSPALDEAVGRIYKARVEAGAAAQLLWRYDLPTDLAVQLPHLYLFVIPVALGDCYHDLGDFKTAEGHYLSAAGYGFASTTVEVPALWQKLARNALDWGDLLYASDEPEQALAIYRKLLEPPGAAGGTVVDPASPLYAHPRLRPVGDQVRAMLEAIGSGAPITLNPVLAAVVLQARARLLQLAAGLDFLGVPATYVPIWTFEFLQNVARYFAQQAAQAEREYVSWQDRSENEALTRRQLQQATVQAQAERELARQQREAAEAEVAAFDRGVDLAVSRRTNAQQNRNDYETMSWERIWLSRSNAWYSSQNPWELEHRIVGSGPDAGRHVHEVIADNTQRLQTITRGYELAVMDRTIAELNAAETAARAQRQAAGARREAAQQMEVVSQLRVQAAQENLAAFDSQVFTADVWRAMGEFMRSISASYLEKAVRTARLMQRAYNFETGLDRRFIRVDYSSAGVAGLLAADALLLDIDSFTYDLITSLTRKQIPVKQTVSLAERYPFLFETEFRRTGRLTFETRVEDFDLAHPGTFAQRLRAVEIDVDGILPAGGARGTLTNGGLSRYRTDDVNVLKFRVQPLETMVLSEYRAREDAVVFPPDPRALGVFEGAGVTGTWTLEVPPETNDLDYRAITDVRLTFDYVAEYSPVLAAAVRARLAGTTGAAQQGRPVSTRWSYPDAFFLFGETGRLTIPLTPLDFPYNVVDPQLEQVAVVVVTDPSVVPTGWVVRLGTPGHPATIPAPAAADGHVAADTGHPWEPLAAGPAAGDYLVELRADENPGLVVDGRLSLDAIQDVLLILEYTFTPRA